MVFYTEDTTRGLKELSILLLKIVHSWSNGHLISPSLALF